MSHTDLLPFEWRFAWILLLGSLGAVLGSGCRQDTEPRPGSDSQVLKVKASPALRKTLNITTTQPGRIVADRETPLHAKIVGYVEEVLVDIGDVVKKGQVLVRLAVPELHKELAQSEAVKRLRASEVKLSAAQVVVAEEAVKAAKAHTEEAIAAVKKYEGDLARWKSEHARILKLSAGGSLSVKVVEETLQQLRSAEAATAQAAARVQTAQAELARDRALVAQARADHEAAKAKEDVAQAGVDRIQALVAYTTIQAPFSGRIVRRSVEKGQFVGPGTNAKHPLLVLLQAEKVRLQVEVPETEAPLVDIGDPVAIAIPALQGYRASGLEDPTGPKISRISWGLVETSRTLRAEIDLPNLDGKFRPGMYATVEILLDKRKDVLVLPRAVIQNRDGRAACFLLEDGKARLRELTLGLRTETEVEILQGLAGAEKVIRTSLSSLQPDQEIRPLE